LKVGQTKNPVFKEQEGVNDTAQPLVERSLLDSLIGGNAFGGNLIKDADLVYVGNNSPIHGHLLFHGGDASGNTDFNDVLASGASADFGLAARADYKVFGDWADNTDLTGKNSGKHDFLDIGAGIDYSEVSGTPGAAGIQGNQAVRAELDAQYQAAQKWGVYGEIIADTIALRGGAPANPHSREDIGALIEGTYFINASLELAARYSITELDHRFKVANEDDFQELGLGLNYFLGQDGSWGNHAKLSFDVDYLPYGTPAATGLDYLASPNGHDEFVARGQFQLFF
jgi:hypothetical protein